MDKVKCFSAEVVEKNQETLAAKSFWFDLGGEPFEYLPGQYIQVILEIEKSDKKGNVRPFSIASSPTETVERGGQIMVATNMRDSAFKRTLAQVKIGDRVQIRGPFGEFVFDEPFEEETEEKRQHVFLIGGIGITPARSMIKYALDRDIDEDLLLLYSNRTAEEIVFRKDLEIWEANSNNFELVYVITRPEESKEKVAGETGRINSLMINKYVEDLEKAIFYVCGPPLMVDNTVEFLEKMNVAAEQIRFERFEGY